MTVFMIECDEYPYDECQYAECRYDECQYAECRFDEYQYAECYGAFHDTLFCVCLYDFV